MNDETLDSTIVTTTSAGTSKCEWVGDLGNYTVHYPSNSNSYSFPNSSTSIASIGQWHTQHQQHTQPVGVIITPDVSSLGNMPTTIGRIRYSDFKQFLIKKACSFLSFKKHDNYLVIYAFDVKIMVINIKNVKECDRSELFVADNK